MIHQASAKPGQRVAITLRFVLLSLLSGCAAPCAESAPADLARARDVFRLAIAKAYDVRPGAVVVQPACPGLPDNPFEPLQTGPFFALRADFAGYEPGPQGFATVDGRSVFALDSSAMGELLTAAKIGQPESTPSIESVLQRVRWIYRREPDGRLVSFHPVALEVTAPAMQFDPASQQFSLIYYTEEPRETGAVLTYRLQLQGKFGEAFKFQAEGVR